MEGTKPIDVSFEVRRLLLDHERYERRRESDKRLPDWTTHHKALAGMCEGQWHKVYIVAGLGGGATGAAGTKGGGMITLDHFWSEECNG